MLAEGLAGFERARRELSRRVAEELEAARHESARLAQASAARVLEEAERAAEAEAVIGRGPRGRGRTLAAKSRSETSPAFAELGSEGRVVAFDGDWAHLESRGKRHPRPPIGARARIGQASPQSGRRDPRGRRPCGSRAAERRGGTDGGGQLIGQRVEEALDAVERRSTRRSFGRGAPARHPRPRDRPAARGLREHFRNHGAVASLRSADRTEGGNGATILELR